MGIKPTYEELEQRVRQLEEDAIFISEKAQMIQSGISNLVEPKLSIEETIERVINLIPQSSLKPNMICARSIVNDREYKTDNFMETNWKYRQDIIVHNEVVGFLEFYSLEERKDIKSGPFMEAEINLFNGLVSRLEHIIEHKQIMGSLERSDANLAEAQRIAHLGSWKYDLEKKELFWSDEMYRILGMIPEEIALNDIDLTIRTVSERVHCDDSERYHRAVEGFMRDKANTGCTGF